MYSDLAAGWMSGDSRLDSWQVQIFYRLKYVQTDYMGRHIFLLYGVLGANSPRVKQLELKADHPRSSAEVKNKWR